MVADPVLVVDAILGRLGDVAHLLRVARRTDALHVRRRDYAGRAVVIGKPTARALAAEGGGPGARWLLRSRRATRLQARARQVLAVDAVAIAVARVSSALRRRL